MRIFFLIFTTIIASVKIFSQYVRETKINVLDADRYALNIEIGYESKIIEDAWTQKTSELKIKGKYSKGLLVYEAVKLLDIHYESVDLYVQIDKVDKLKSNFTIAISKGAGNFIGEEDTIIVNNTKKFLLDFLIYCEQYKLKLDIKDLEDQIKKVQKEHEKLVDEGKKLEQQIEKNKADQEAKIKEILTLQTSLEQLRLKLK